MGKESLDSCPRLKLADINPFNPRQRKIINLILEGKKYKQIARQLGYVHQHIRNLVAGPYSYSIFSKVERITGERPYDKQQLITMLAGDVLFLRKDGDGTEKLATE
jgi:hypothetical protein